MASCDRILAFQMSVIWFGISTTICQPVVELPSLWTTTLPLKPLLQESDKAKCASRSPAGSVGGVVGGVDVEHGGWFLWGLEGCGGVFGLRRLEGWRRVMLGHWRLI